MVQLRFPELSEDAGTSTADHIGQGEEKEKQNGKFNNLRFPEMILFI